MPNLKEFIEMTDLMSSDIITENVDNLIVEIGMYYPYEIILTDKHTKNKIQLNPTSINKIVKLIKKNRIL